MSLFRPRTLPRAPWRMPADRADDGMKNRPLIVGEVAQAHDGSLGMAHAFIDAIANAGADAVKFQTHIAEAESTRAEPWRVRFSYQDASRYEYWKRMEFTEDQWSGLRRHALERGLAFVSSPFSVQAVELLKRVGVEAWKIASGEVTNEPLWRAMAQSQRPVWLSSGMSTWAELDHAVRRIQEAGLDLVLFQCSSIYPTPPEKVGLNLLQAFRSRYGCRVGLSDHSATVAAGLGATTLGAEVIEVHVTLSREAFGPDVIASLTTTELRQLVDGARFLRRALDHPVDKDATAGELQDMRRTFGRSMVARVGLEEGTVLAQDHLDFRKPGSGIPPSRLGAFVGRRLRRPIQPGELLTEDHVDG